MTATAPDPPLGNPYFGGKAPQPLPWNPLGHMQEFLDNLEADEAAYNYRRVVKVGLSHFANHCRAEGLKHPGEIERAHLLRFQTYLQDLTKPNGEPYALSYRQQLMKYVRSYINWCADIGYIDANPWHRIKVGQATKKPNPLEDEEIATLFAAHRNQAFQIAPFVFHRREVILVLLYAWGLRIHELASLTCSQMDLRQDWVSVRNKGGKRKTEPYGLMLKQVIQRWMVVRARHATPGEDALLIGAEGQALSIQMIRKIVTDLGLRAGVPVNPHRFRDSFGTTMLDHDVEVERIMAMMGHTQRRQTLAYSRVNNPKLAESHDRVMTPLLGKLLGG
jgi:site-specific recombinase XerD